MRILGVDPGSRLTGYGCVDVVQGHLRHVTHGTLKLADTHGKAVVPLEDRLHSIYEGLSEVIQKFKPQMMVVEKVFFAKNALSALKLGQARGVVMLTGKIHDLQIFEYSATEVKSAVAGYGQADKEEVAKMVQLRIGKLEVATWDASDGLALAICHAHTFRGGKPDLQQISVQRKRKKFSLAESVRICLPKKG